MRSVLRLVHYKPFMLTLLAALLMFFLAQSETAYAATITVNTTVDELNNDGDCSLREAIQAANTDTAVSGCTAGSGADTITLPAGTYTLSIAGTGENANATGDLDITGDLTINGAGEATTFINGDAIDRVLQILSGKTVSISGLTITNGNSSGGGGILNQGDLTLANTTVSGNAAGSGGGGILNVGIGATLTMSNTTVSGNAITGSGGGGGIRNIATLILTSSTVSGNAGSGSGGGIYNQGASSTVTLTDSTVSANPARHGGGIYMERGTLILNNSTVSDNTSSGGSGGGIGMENATVTLNDSTVSGNTAVNGRGGGGISNSRDSTLTLNNSSVSGNTAVNGSGGGIHSPFGNLILTLNDSTVSGNTANGAGGGIYHVGNSLTLTTLTLTNSTISGNTAVNGRGGGILQFLGTLTLTNSTISGNTATLDGGGIWVRGTSTLSNGTVSGNTTDALGGGIFINDGTASLKNTIIAGNIASTNGPDCFGSPTSLGYNLIGDETGCGLTPVVGDQVGGGANPIIDPLLDSLALNAPGTTATHALQSGSPAIDAGNPSGCTDAANNALTTDQRGVARPQGSACDIGAFELEVSSVDFTLSVTVVGNGDVTSDLSIDCPDVDCTEDYADGTVVTLTAVADAGWVFTAWTGAGTGDAPGTRSVTMDGNESVTATFLELFTLSVTVSGNGSVTSVPAGITCGADCSEDYADGTVATLTAVADAGWVFSAWTGAGAGDAPGTRSVTMDGNESVTATFLELFTLSVTVAGNGSVTSVPAGITCGADCSEDYADGTVVTLTAVADAGWVFSAWTGAGTGDAPGIRSVTMDGNESVTATFLTFEEAAEATVEELEATLDDLPDSDFQGDSKSKNKGRNNQRWFSNQLDAVLGNIEADLFEDALDNANNILGKVDGCAERGAPDPEDKVVTCNGQAEVDPLVRDLIALLEELVS